MSPMHCEPNTLARWAILCAAVLAGSSISCAQEPRARQSMSAPAESPFSDADNALLDEVQHGCFLYFWKEVGEPAKLVRDRKKARAASSAAVGFQLSSLPIGVERGWITREQGERRALTVLRAMVSSDDNKRFGIYVHFPDRNTGGASRRGYELLASTVDHALFAAGAIVAGEYFGGEAKSLADRIVAEADWNAYAVGPRGFLSMGWKPTDRKNMRGEGEFLSAHWSWASAEERLIYFLGTGSPTSDHALDPQLYYRLRRPVKRHADGGPPYVVSWNGALFTYFFAQCWIDYRLVESSDPGVVEAGGPDIDWRENSRRAVLTHRRRCIEQAGRYKTFAPDRWGLSPCASRGGYLVPQVQPNGRNADRWGEGTVAPYAAGAAMMFTPRESLDVLRALRNLKDDSGKFVVWRDPAAGGYGFADSFNLDQGFVSDDYVGIDQGPMLLGIENARTGLIWKLFMRSATAERSIARLKLDPGTRIPGLELEGSFDEKKKAQNKSKNRNKTKKKKKFDPRRWEKAIRVFEDRDAKSPPAEDAVLFVGSSSIVGWKTDESFPDLPVIKRGFGGSHISDVNHFVSRIVKPYDPRVVVLYAGDNDVAAGKSPRRVLADYREFVRRVREVSPDVAIIFIAIKPSIARWKLWPQMEEANELIEALVRDDDRQFYADIATPMFGDDGKPQPALLLSDGLHMTPAGYRVWTDVLRPLIDRALRARVKAAGR